VLVSARGIPDLLDTIRVNHVSGGVSIVGLKTYASGREKFQGETLDYVWLDEEPPADIYTEALTRTNLGASPVWLTFTPLQGVSTVVKRFLHEKSDDRYKVVMTIDDVEHYNDDEKQKIIASYPRYEVEARTKGIPVLGSGRVFPVAEETLAIDNREFPPHWPRIGGMDFGWTHAFAAVELTWDRDTDTVYVSKTHRLKEASPIVHAAALRAWGKELRWAWPRDCARDTIEGAGIALAGQFRDQGLNLLHDFAHYVEGTGQKSVSVEAGLMDMLQRMESGRFKVFKHLNDWFEEFRLYHRKDGKVVKEGDDLMCATRYAIMMLRHASTTRAYHNFRRKLVYHKIGIA
jgi:phage terminase large subunit-like protein